MRTVLHHQQHYRNQMRGVLEVVLLALSFFWAPSGAVAADWVDPDRSLPLAGCAQVALAGVLDGNWEIVILDVESSRLLNLTRSPDDERSPAWSPDGRAIAFAARRGFNWDIYTLMLADGAVRRLTDSPAYDGQPSWSPDGTRIAFESDRDSNLEIYTLPAQGGAPTRITDDPSADIEPIWTFDNQGLVFGSWRSGTRQLYYLDLATQKTVPLTAPGEEARQPALSPDGHYLAYVTTHDSTSHVMIREMDRGSVAEYAARAVQQEWPAWQPDSRVAGYQPSLLTLGLASSSGDRYPTDWSLDFYQGGSLGGHQDAKALVTLSGQWEHPACAPGGTPPIQRPWQPIGRAVATHGSPDMLPTSRGLTALPGVQAIQPRLAAVVAMSFQRLRQQTIEASGYDFLGELNDAWRGLDHPAGRYLSWHKAGRAFDTRDWYAPAGQQGMFIARQILGGQTYFRIYLRAARQDGSQGAPLRESLWETAGRLSDPQIANAGGRMLSPPTGYFVDFTDLAEREGWTRIPGLTLPDGDWRHNYLDLEFWHYERRDSLSWYAAMQQIYNDDQLQARFTPELLRAHGYTTGDMLNAGIPGVLAAECSVIWKVGPGMC